jgi:AcrR family transcriptional regulator
MGRWEPDARGRLVEAAFALYSERGYEQTTAAEIAKRAGLTERTFFRHFTDKREVLFWGGTELQELMVGAVKEVPDSATPMEMVAAALAAISSVFQERQDGSRQRQAIIATSTELQERELIKLASMATALADVLRVRGVPAEVAGLSAEVGLAVFRVSFERWLHNTEHRELSHYIGESLDGLKALTSDA